MLVVTFSFGNGLKTNLSGQYLEILNLPTHGSVPIKGNY